MRSKRYRWYIYYPGINPEELYDQEEDPHEWENIAYQTQNLQIIADHRKMLLGLLPELTWKEISSINPRILSDQ